MRWKNLRFWASRAERVQLNRYEDDIVGLIAKKKETEYDVQNASKEIEALRLKHQQELAKLRADFDIQQGRREEEMRTQAARASEETERLKRTLSAEHELLVKEIQTLHKIEMKQVKDEANLSVQKQVMAERENLMKQRASDVESNYQQLSAAMSKLHAEGNSSTKFIQEMSLKMLEMSPQVNRLNLDVNRESPRQIVTVENDDS